MLAVALGDSLDDRADLLCDTALSADDFAHILRSNTQFKNGIVRLLSVLQ